MTSSINLRLHTQDELWFPGLATELLADFASRSQASPSLLERYGTARWMAGDTSVPAPTGGEISVGPHVANIEYLPPEAVTRFGGLQFATEANGRIRGKIQAAADVIDRVPGMSASIGPLMKSIHPLKAPTDHDVSHSTPELPFSVFVSVPENDERDSSVRVAESLIHESMHLQLTLVDLIDPLAEDYDSTGYSPWKDELRPVTGLLHGLYVFAVIYQALETLMAERDDWYRYSVKRRTEITREVAMLPKAPGGLSRTGAALWCASRGVVETPRRNGP